MDYAKLKEKLQGLLTEKSTPEEASVIADVVKDIDSAQKEQDDFIIKHEELRQKYIKALQQSTFGKEPDDLAKQPQPKTLEDCIKEQAQKENGGK